MSPDDEKELLALLLETAEGLAQTGELAAGYALLAAGRRRAERAVSHGKHPAGAFVSRYRAAEDRYGSTFSVLGEDAAGRGAGEG